jgi:hypothetical protein
MKKAFLLLTALAAPALAADPVPYPEGYRGWTHVKGMVIDKGHESFVFSSYRK